MNLHTDTDVHTHRYTCALTEHVDYEQNHHFVHSPTCTHLGWRRGCSSFMCTCAAPYEANVYADEKAPHVAMYISIRSAFFAKTKNRN